ncbi:MAG: phosphate ABC transporter permease PstA [Methylococcaceae bacterium]|nr:phosphate ABC transporter permease PstA [Methylococcaceae bacterium]
MIIKQWLNSGSPWIWLNAAAVSTCLILVLGILGLVAVRGLGHYWPSDVAQIQYREKDGTQQVITGEITDHNEISAARAKDAGYLDADIGSNTTVEQVLLKIGNRDVGGMDFRWILTNNIQQSSYPEQLVVLERREWGNFYGSLLAVKSGGKNIAQGADAWVVAQQRIAAALEIHDDIKQLEKKQIGAVNYALDRLRLKQRKLELQKAWTDTAKQAVATEKAAYQVDYKRYQEQLKSLYAKANQESLVIKTGDGIERDIPIGKIVKAYQPNGMGIFTKIGHYFGKLGEFLSEDPREANTEGGIFPAIFGTVLMVMLMAVIVTPFGVIAAVYLREYAKQGFTTRLIRIAVNNLAGVPSIVYGVFGLGFFVYILGGKIDHLFYPESAPAPVFGTPGLMWASITLALLTLPVVIVATEEGLSRIPKSIREGSLALGATKFETLWLTVLPMASPAMMTGLILAVARAAGEVAPLMLVGVVKLAPTLPLDGNFPFLHLDRKFMHLGFHIYDVGFQSPNVEAARPIVYATSLLLVTVIVGLNLTAVTIRNHLREKYRALEG